MPLLEQNRPLEIRRSSGYEPPTPEQKQRRQMLTALGLLVLALVLVIVKDRDFWFPPAQVAEVTQTAPAPETAATQPPQAVPIPQKKQHSARRRSRVLPKVAVAQVNASAPIAPVVTNRAVLPPLEIEVIAGDQRQTAQDKNNSIGLAMGSAGSEPARSVITTSDVVSNASQSSNRMRLSTDTTQVVSHPVEPNYPLLAKEMKVQGSVVLEALIGKDGHIQNLHIVSGPTILSSAAREAVQQWRFKPYYQSGQPVETIARITVNFTISAN
jgi:TonB family protein